MGRAWRGWVIVPLATLVLYVGLLSAPRLWPGKRLLGEHWNWSGSLLALAAVLWIATRLSRHAGLARHEMGLTLTQRPGSMRPALWVATVALLLNMLAMSLSNYRVAGVAPETWIYQATLPGLVEEAAFRGVMLASLDRAFVGRKNCFGAPIGWGGVIVTLVFLALHGIRLGTLFGVLPAALLYLWLRARTGSLVMPVAVHNLWNLSVYAAHL